MNQETEHRRVCLLISTFYPFVGGGEKHAQLLCREIANTETELLVLTRRTERRLDPATTVDGVPVYRVGPSGWKRLGKYLMLAPIFLQLIRHRKRYDVILVSGLRLLSIPALMAARLLGKKCVLRAASCGELSGAFIWDSPHLQGKRVQRSIFRGLIAVRNKLFLQADGFLAISTAIQREYRECGVPDSKICLINNGTDTDTYKPVPPEQRGALRQRLGLPEGCIFAYSGKLNRGKGLPFLLGVWHDLVKGRPGHHLVLVGSGKGHFLSCEEELRRYAGQHGLWDSITFTGFVENVHEYLQAADVFVFPSENESLSNAVIEAMACELPCLASAIGGIPDSVVDGENGRLLPPGDHTAWLEAMEEAADAPEKRAALGAGGRARVLRRNSIRQVAETYLTFLDSV